MIKRSYKKPDKIFAGIGNRDTPTVFANQLTAAGKRLFKEQGYWWATGGNGNADNACMSVSMCGYVYPPWERFNGFPMRWPLPRTAFDKAKEYCPYWDSMSKGARALHARNMQVIAGPYVDYNDRVDLVICYTRDGCENKATYSKQTGGTGSAICFASDLDIPVVNLANPKSMEYLSIFTGVDMLDLELPKEAYFVNTAF